MGQSNTKLMKIDVKKVKPFLFGKLLKCKIIRVYNFYTYDILFKYNKKYIIWKFTMSELFKDLIDRNDSRICNIIKENNILYVLIHGLRDNLLVGDFYLKKKDKKSLNSLIIEEMNKDFYQNIYRQSFKIKKDNRINCNINNTKIYPNLEEINQILPIPEELNKDKVVENTEKNNFNTQKKKSLNFLDELKRKQQLQE